MKGTQQEYRATYVLQLDDSQLELPKSVLHICAPSSSVRLLMMLSTSTVLSHPLWSLSTTLFDGRASSLADEETMALRGGMAA